LLSDFPLAWAPYKFSATAHNPQILLGSSAGTNRSKGPDGGRRAPPALTSARIITSDSLTGDLYGYCRILQNHGQNFFTLYSGGCLLGALLAQGFSLSEGSDWKRKCIYTTATECDVTDLLENVKDKYTARIISEVQDAEDFTEEAPYTDSPPFSPYQQTIIGKPVIDGYNFSKDHTKLTVIIKDPLTPYRFSNGNFKSIRDIFNNDLTYTVLYRRSSSTGKKQETSNSNEIVIKVDRGESYCFYVQATIPSRSQNRVSQVSDEKCTTASENAASTIGSPSEFIFLCSWILLYWLL
uniref:Tissue factor n=1 Tax=Xenopus tropicalis TaxID=8364 RepID=A0A803JRF7_XENTR